MCWDIRGPAITTGNFFTHMVLRGHERFDFTVVSRTVDPAVRPLVRWLRAPAPLEPFRLRWAVFFLTGALRLPQARADLVHAWGPAPMVPNRIDIASVNMLQSGYHAAAGGRPPGHGPGWRIGRSIKLGLEGWTYGRRSGLVAVETERTKAVVEEHVPRAEVIVVPQWVDTERFSPDPDDSRRIRAELGAAADDTIALFVGRDWALKGLEPAIAGVAEARRRGATGLRLWVAGGDNPKTLRRIAEDHGVADRVEDLGFRGDVERLCRGADIALLPTLYEHFCRACYEAAATERPVVATDVGGIARLIDGGAGIAVERDGDSIAEALITLAADPDLRARMGKRGRELAVGFTREGSTDRYLDLYDELLAARGEKELRSTSSR